MRVIAIDWSGAKVGASKYIWRADVVDGKLVYLQNGFSAEQVCAQLIALAGSGERIAVGLDFAFSLPGWFLTQENIESGPELWRRVADSDLGEVWLHDKPWPFWGGSTKKPENDQPFRRTEIEVKDATGFAPKSVFQVGGIGSVGTGSLRGMRYLHKLRNAGFCVWPFDAPSFPVVLEIYPRVFTGSLAKSDPKARVAHIDDRVDVPASMRDDIVGSEDALDASVSALEMWLRRAELEGLPPARDNIERLEGTVWIPKTSAAR